MPAGGITRSFFLHSPLFQLLGELVAAVSAVWGVAGLGVSVIVYRYR